MSTVVDGDGAPEVDGPGGSVTLQGPVDAPVLRVSGALDLALAPRLQQLADRVFRGAPEVLVVDLTGLTFLASTGMSTLLRIQREHPPRTSVRIVATGRVVLRPLQLTRLTEELDLYPTLEAAQRR
jgi:anti-anti-sigma factor